MSKFILVFISILFCITNTLFAQDISRQFGEVTEADFDITNIEEESDLPPAIVLHDIGLSRFEESNESNGFNLIFERRTKIKINTKAGFQYGEVEVPLYHRNGQSYEKVKKIKAFTWNIENGKLVKTELNKKDVFEEKATEKWRLTKFALPNVKEGSIIEFQYTVVSPYYFNLVDWKFQRKIPTLYSEYTARMIPFLEYVCLTNLYQKLAILDNHIDKKRMPRSFGGVSYYDNVYTYGMENIPAFKDESFITSVDDYISKLDFQLSKIIYPNGVKETVISTWDELEKELLDKESFGGFIKKSKKSTQKIVTDAAILDKSEMERFNFAVDYVKQNFRSNKKVGLRSLPLKTFLEQKKGNICTVNLYLTTLLQAAELEAYPLILSTRNHGKIFEDYPIIDFFNYTAVVVRVNGKWLLTDGTNPLAANMMIPAQCFNGKGLILAPKLEDRWILLSQNLLSMENYKFNINLSEQKDSLIADMTLSTAGYDALSLKDEFEDDTKAIRQYWEKERNLNLLSPVTTQNYSDRMKKYKLSFNASMPVDRLDDQILIKPFLTTMFTVNPLKQKERNYPVNLTYSYLRYFQAQINIPDGYEIANLPEDLKVDDDLMKIQYQILAKDKRIMVIGQYQFKKTMYLPKEYKQLQQHFADLVAYFNQKVGLKKIDQE